MLHAARGKRGKENAMKQTAKLARAKLEPGKDVTDPQLKRCRRDCDLYGEIA